MLGFLTAMGYVTGDSLFSRLHTGVPDVPGESRSGQDLLSATSETGPGMHLVLDGIRPEDPRVRTAVVAAARDVTEVPGIRTVLHPYLADQPAAPERGQDRVAAASPELIALGAAQVSADGRALLVTVLPAADLPEAVADAAEDAATARLRRAGAEVITGVPGSRALVGGYTAIFNEITGQVRRDLETGEAVALPISLLLMVVVFGGFVAAGLPLVGAVASIAGGLAALLGFSFVVDLDASVVNVVTLLGLGLCIDYCLLIVSRYREELRVLLADRDDAGPDRDDTLVNGDDTLAGRDDPATGDGRDLPTLALGRTLATAGRTVAFSAVIVGISLSGLFAFSSDLLRAGAPAGVRCVVVAVLTALTLVPALLAIVGHRVVRPGITHRVPGLRRVVRRLGDVPPREGAFSRLARRVQRRPALVLAGVLAVLATLAVPALDLTLVSSGHQHLPSSSPQRQVYDTIETRFPAVAGASITVVARAPEQQVRAWWASGALQNLPGVASVEEPRVQSDPSAGQVVVIGVRPDGAESSATARRLVREIRDVRPDFPTWVTGPSAHLEDFVAAFLREGPLAVGVVVLATFVLLFLLTGSVLVPIKALLMNVVSLGASFGVLVWVFQDGHLEGLLGFTSTGAVETSIPALVLAFGFGLAMDYEVFLLSRIKEFHDAGADNDDAVVMGLQRTGRIITSAALIMVVVFAGFTVGRLLIIKQTGVALATAVAVDATLVRLLLVPATMTLLGEWNWWAPAPLRRLHRRLGLNHGDTGPRHEAPGHPDDGPGDRGGCEPHPDPDSPRSRETLSS